MKYGRLTLLRELPRMSGGSHYWLARCDCGTVKEVLPFNLKNGNTKSCGCLRRERFLTHGMYGTPEYKSWACMLSRCTDPNFPRYSDYGGRGIAVCRRWLKFENFFSDMGLKPFPRAQIERKNNEAGYKLSNCCWVSNKQNCRNKRTTAYVVYAGRRMSLVEAAELAGLPYGALQARRAAGWTGKKLFSEIRK